MYAFIDSHNHSLPYIDDGAKDTQMGIDMLKASAADNVETVILTPHHLNGAFSNQKQKIIESFESFQELVNKEVPSITLHLGSEVHLVDSSADEILSGNAMTYANKDKAALIEFPKHNIPLGADKVLSQLLYNGITPIIAHPERNTSLRKDQSPLKEWVEMGCKSQVTAMSCEGRFGSEIQAVTFNMLSDGLVHLIASDAHRPTGRSPKLSDAASIINKRFSNEVTELLFHKNPERLLKGEDLLSIKPLLKNKKTRKKRFFWL